MKIKINKVELTTKQIDEIIESPYTLNLTNMKSTKQKIKKSLKTYLFISLAILGLVIGLNVFAYNSLNLEDEFNIVIEKEEVTDQDIDNLIKAIDKEYNEVSVKNEEVSVTSEVKKEIKPLEFDIDRLAKAVAKHETKDCTLGNSAERNNCFGIMQWDKHGVRSYKSYNTKEDSYKDFKRIWTSFYGGFPTYAQAKRYSGNDRVDAWLRNVTYFYQTGLNK